jgi:hypothetical protein
MSEFKVKVGRLKPAKAGAKPPPERKAIHPGLQQIATDIQCLKCGAFLEWSAFGRHATLSVTACSCGLWFMDEKLKIRWIRWSSASFFSDGREVFSPEK